MKHVPKTPTPLSAKQVQAILDKIDWPAYHNRVIEAIQNTYRCRCKDCMKLPKEKRYIL